MRAEDDALRRLALLRLGPHAPALARAALESGVVEVETDVLSWQGSSGTVHGHRAFLAVDGELAADLRAAPSSIDALTAAFAAAIAERPGNALAELEVIEYGGPPRGSPYRGRAEPG